MEAAVLTRYPGNRWFFTLRFLALLADGGNRLEVRRRLDGGYEAAEWYVDVRYDTVPPNPQYVEGLPSALASFEPGFRRALAGLTRPFRRLASAGWSGHFDFPVGPRFIVLVSYRVKWRWWRLAELDVWIAGDGPLAAIARTDFDLMSSMSE
jgi:hypothetical protein